MIQIEWDNSHTFKRQFIKFTMNTILGHGNRGDKQ